MKKTLFRASFFCLSLTLPMACNKAKDDKASGMDPLEAAYAKAAANGGISSKEAFATDTGAIGNVRLQIGKDVIKVSNKGEVSGDVEGGKVVSRIPTVIDQKAILGCSKAFGQPLPIGEDGKVRTIAANVAILSGGSTLVDNRVTEQPELTIVMASVNVLGAMNWQLMNPNGMYCIVTNVNILSRLTVEISSQAKLADGTLGVNILSASDGSTSSVGVNILSRVKVIKK